jgi:cytochrome c553
MAFSCKWLFILTFAVGLIECHCLAATMDLKSPHASPGEAIYNHDCASCHGDHGQGTKINYPHALTGNRSVEQLAGYIAKSMPADKPGTCTGEHARQAAEYIYDAFYSPLAQARDRPARIALARLTVAQYANAVADIFGSFRSAAAVDARRGLEAKYTKGHEHGDKPIERLDAAIDFDFGEKGPKPGTIDPKEYSIRWTGSVFAPETGDYEFSVECTTGVRLEVNTADGDDKPVIDAEVRSGSENVHRATVRLLGGRTYPIRLHLSKNKGDKTCKIVLRWRQPQGVEEVLPSRYLSPGSAPPVFIVQTPFPADDRSTGFERGTSISKAWEQATTDAALEAADYASSHMMAQMAKSKKSAEERHAAIRDVCRQFVERAFRRPLSPEQKQIYLDKRFASTADDEVALRRVIVLALKSPNFLYYQYGDRLLGKDHVGKGADDYDVAKRLALVLWDSIPNAALARQAADGKLHSRSQIEAAAREMLADPHARAKLDRFFLQWLKVETVPELSKDPALYHGFDAATTLDLRRSLMLFVDDVVWSKASDFRQLFLSDQTYLNGRLARFYGAALPSDADFTKMAFEPEKRAGVLAHPYLLATFAYNTNSSPIHRGVFIARGVLGLTLRPPPMAVTPLPEAVNPSLTTRERVSLQTRPEACQSCHATINPLGFTLERFDAAGRLRIAEKGHNIDDNGSYYTRDGRQVHFAGARDLATFLAASDEVHEAFVSQLFQYMVKQPIRAFGLQTLNELKARFAKNDYNIQKLVADIAVVAAGGG